MKKAVYQDAFQSVVKGLSPNTGKDTMNSPNLTKGGITISKDLIPDDLNVGDEIKLKVSDVDNDKNEIHFEYEGLETPEDIGEPAETTSPKTL